MTIQEFNEALSRASSDLNGNAGSTLLVQTANDALALIRKRIQERGEDSEGGKYKPYSKEPMLSGGKNLRSDVAEKLIGSKNKRKSKNWVTIQRGGQNYRLFEIPGGYNEYRQLHGRQTEFVDFTFTGRMMGNAALGEKGDIEVELEAQNIAVIGCKSESERKKMAGNVERRGLILMVNNQEIKILTEIYSEGVINILKKYGIE